MYLAESTQYKNNKIGIYVYLKQKQKRSGNQYRYLKLRKRHDLRMIGNMLLVDELGSK